MSAEKKITELVYVDILMHDGACHHGYVHLPFGVRLQDLMNDERNFMPLSPTPLSKSVIVISKKYIVTVVESVEVETARGLGLVALK